MAMMRAGYASFRRDYVRVKLTSTGGPLLMV